MNRTRSHRTPASRPASRPAGVAPAASVRPPTERQEHVLGVLRAYVAEHGVSPTMRELAPLLNVTSLCTVQRHLEALERKGLISRERYKYRAIRLHGMPDPAAELAALRSFAAAVQVAFGAGSVGAALGEIEAAYETLTAAGWKPAPEGSQA